MRVLVTGATGLIGSAISARLVSLGHEVYGIARSIPARSLNHTKLMRADMARLTTERDWQPYLQGVDAVVNCAGILQDSPSDSTSGVHHRGAAALFAACAAQGIRRVVHFSAIGVDVQGRSKFSATKLAGDKALTALDLDWVILRPSVVLGRPAYGGSALLRGAAALPLMPAFPDTGPLQVVQLDEVVDTAIFFLAEAAPSQLILELAGPERLSFDDVAGTYRNWLGWKPQKPLRVPLWGARLAFGLGDLVSLLGWKAPARSNARMELERGAVGDNSRWKAITGIEPRSLRSALASEPASVQERWFAPLFVLKPLVLGVFALFWLTTGIVALGPGWSIGMSLMREGGVEGIGPLLIVGGALSDILIGLGIAYRRTARFALWAALAISIAYVIIGTALVPRLWADPLGPMLKIWPILVFNLVALAIVDDR